MMLSAYKTSVRFKCTRFVTNIKHWANTFSIIKHHIETMDTANSMLFMKELANRRCPW